MPEDPDKSPTEETTDTVAPAATDSIETPETDKAVEQIVHQESDELIAKKDDDKSFVPPKRHLYKKFLHNKKLAIPTGVVALFLLLAAIPFTRYPLFGLFWKQTYKLQILDSQTDQPISEAIVSLAGKTMTTDNQGRASLHVRVGHTTLSVTKNYYAPTSQKVLVGLHARGLHSFSIKATGRQVPLTVINKISGKPLANVLVKAVNTQARTDKNGKVAIVLPADKNSVAANLSAAGYNPVDATIQVTIQAVKANSFGLTPSGKVYFLSNLSGKIDVVKSNLDGSGRQTVLGGTGSEDSHSTVLLASRDWKFLALLAKRNGANAELDLIDTSTDKVTNIDKGNVGFTAVGWSDHLFIYEVYRPDVALWQPNQSTLKSFNAEAGKLTVIDQTLAEGSATDYAYQDFGTNDTHIVGDRLIYIKEWNAYYPSASRLDGKNDQIVSAAPDGSSKQSIKDLPLSSTQSYQYIYSSVPTPQNIYFQIGSANSTIYYSYTSGSVTQVNTITNDIFNQAYPTYLVSPSDSQTFWAEQRDGKNSLFVGDKTAKNQKQIASLSDFQPYGWYSDDYLLVSKNSSQLFIMPVSGPSTTVQPLKLTDYYKPAQSFNGYGYGYGGL